MSVIQPVIHTPIILAIDLGKFNSVFYNFNTVSKVKMFRTVPTR